MFRKSLKKTEPCRLKYIPGDPKRGKCNINRIEYDTLYSLVVNIRRKFFDRNQNCGQMV